MHILGEDKKKLDEKMKDKDDELKHQKELNNITKKIYDPLHIKEFDMATGEYKQLEEGFKTMTRYAMQQEIKELRDTVKDKD